MFHKSKKIGINSLEIWNGLKPVYLSETRLLDTKQIKVRQTVVRVIYT